MLQTGDLLRYEHRQVFRQHVCTIKYVASDKSREWTSTLKFDTRNIGKI